MPLFTAGRRRGLLVDADRSRRSRFCALPGHVRRLRPTPLPGGSRRQALARQLLWHGGKTFTYAFLGVLAGFGGAAASGLTGTMPRIQNLVAFAAGAFIILMGISLLGLLPWRRRTADADAARPLLADVLARFFRQPSAGSAFTLGVATGFLPCPVVYGFLAYAVQSRSPAAGGAMMAALGLGTVWALLLLGITGYALDRRFRRWGSLAGGIVLVVLGVTTVLRGTGLMHRMMGHHHQMQMPASAPSDAPMPPMTMPMSDDTAQPMQHN